MDAAHETLSIDLSPMAIPGNTSTPPSRVAVLHDHDRHDIGGFGRGGTPTCQTVAGAVWSALLSIAHWGSSLTAPGASTHFLCVVAMLYHSSGAL